VKGNIDDIKINDPFQACDGPEHWLPVGELDVFWGGYSGYWEAVGGVDSEREPAEEREALEPKQQLVAEGQGTPTAGFEGPRSSHEGGRLALPVPERGGFQHQMDPSAAILVPKRQNRWESVGTNSTPFGNPCTTGRTGRRLGSSRTGRHGM
jgi:hypothetical protein